VAARAGEACDQADADGVAYAGEDDWNRARRLLCRQCRRSAPRRKDDIHLGPDEFGSEDGKTVVASVSPAVLKSDITAVHVTELSQRLPKSFEGRSGAK